MRDFYRRRQVHPATQFPMTHSHTRLGATGALYKQTCLPPELNKPVGITITVFLDFFIPHPHHVSQHTQLQFYPRWLASLHACSRLLPFCQSLPLLTDRIVTKPVKNVREHMDIPRFQIMVAVKVMCARARQRTGVRFVKLTIAISHLPLRPQRTSRPPL